MKEVKLEDLVAVVILGFCEKLEELGCPNGKDVKEWYCNMSYDDTVTVSDKVIEKIERDAEIQKSCCEVCGYSTDMDAEEYHKNTAFGLCLRCMESTGVKGKKDNNEKE